MQHFEYTYNKGYINHIEQHYNSYWNQWVEQYRYYTKKEVYYNLRNIRKYFDFK